MIVLAVCRRNRLGAGFAGVDLQPALSLKTFRTGLQIGVLNLSKNDRIYISGWLRFFCAAKKCNPTKIYIQR